MSDMVFICRPRPIQLADVQFSNVAVAGDITTGLIGWWPMQDNAGLPTVVDTSGFGHNATANGNITSVASGPGGLLPRALQTNGVGFATYSLAALFDWTSGSFSVAGWFYMGDLLVGAGANSQTFWSDDRVGISTANNIDIGSVQVGGGVTTTRIFTQECNIGPRATSDQYSAAGWHHFALTNNGGGAGGTLTQFFDGVPVSPTTSPAGGGNWGVVTASFFSGDSSGNGAMTAGGRLCGMRCYNRVLAPADVSSLFNQIT
jgi:hypothetical protein